MHRQLTARSSLENLKKDAKRWLNALRAKDAEAWERLRAAWPDAPTEPGLRDVQHALAREYGAEGWGQLKEKLDEVLLASRSRAELVEEFLEHACIHYGIRPGTSTWNRIYMDSPSRWRYAAKILERHPWIVSYSIHTAVVSGNLAEVQRLLAARPAAVTEKGGLQQWEPLLYVCFGRLPTPVAAENSVAIVRALIDAGADQHVYFTDGENRFWPLTGAIGGGEFAQPPHAQAGGLATLLIDRGFDPYEPQAMYNTSLGEDDIFWLQFLYERSAQRNETRKWVEPSSTWPRIGMLTYLLSNAVTRNAVRRASWLLERGADARSAHHHTKRNLHSEALIHGFVEMAELLARFGATQETLSGRDAFQAACMRLDRQAAEALAKQHPEYLRYAEPLKLAAAKDNVAVATFLLDFGVSPNVADITNFRPLHAAAAHGSLRVATLLIERGADIDPIEAKFKGVPLGWAFHGNQHAMLSMLGKLSRHLPMLIHAGNVDRVRELLNTDPALAKDSSLLFDLPDDDDRAAELAHLLVTHGADPTVKNPEGQTPGELAEKHGLEATADVLRAT